MKVEPSAGGDRSHSSPGVQSGHAVVETRPDTDYQDSTQKGAKAVVNAACLLTAE